MMYGIKGLYALNVEVGLEFPFDYEGGINPVSVYIISNLLLLE